MTADDIWGHEYIDISGNSYDHHHKPLDWIWHLYYKENDGHAFMKHGPQRRICLRMNPTAELQEATESMKNYRESDPPFDKKIAKNVFSELENMIKEGKRDSEIKY